MENHRFTCPNPKCKKIFAKPVQITYYGCPFCSIKITDQCPHYFGYLSERAKGEKILEECMVCKKLLECMLSTVKKSKTAIEEIQKWYVPSKDKAEMPGLPST
jgi:hypothetical protein